MSRILIALFALSFTASSVFAADTSLTKKDVEAIVKQYIAEHPDLIIGSLQAYQAKKHLSDMAGVTKKLGKFQADTKADKIAPVSGNPQGDVMIVEFFDYHCGYCKRMLPTITKLLDGDKNIRLVLKEFPILSEDSTTASKASLAFYRLNPSKYFEYHSQLMQHNGSFDEAYLLTTAQKLGVEPDKLKKEMASPDFQKELDQNRAAADELQVRGTPAFVIGDQLVPGAVDYHELVSMVKAAREGAKGGKKAG